MKSTVCGAVFSPAITSIIGMMCGGFDQCMPTTRAGFEMKACSLVIGRPDVSEATMVSAGNSASRAR